MLARFTYTILLLAWSNISYALTLSCYELERNQTAKGWLPYEFKMKISTDLATIKVLDPISDYFGKHDFEKAFIGTDYWSRGKGKTKKGAYYNYTIQLNFQDDLARYKMTMSQHGFKDLTVSGKCERVEDGRTPTSQNKKWNTQSKNDTSLNVNGSLATFKNPEQSTTVKIDTKKGYIQYASTDTEFKTVYDNATDAKKGSYIIYLGDDENFTPYPEAWHRNRIETINKNDKPIVRIHDSAIRNFNWGAKGKFLHFYVKCKGKWVGTTLQIDEKLRSELNKLAR